MADGGPFSTGGLLPRTLIGSGTGGRGGGGGHRTHTHFGQLKLECLVTLLSLAVLVLTRIVGSAHARPAQEPLPNTLLSWTHDEQVQE